MEFAEALAKRIVEIAPGQAQAAAALLDGLFESSRIDASRATASVLAVGTISVNSMEQALGRCRGKAWSPEPFQSLTGREGAVAGYAAVLGRDSKAINAILAVSDRPARVALLEAARISGEKLNYDKVVRLLDDRSGENECLATAADDYLWDSGDLAARRFRLEHSRKDGEVIAWDPDKGTYGAHDRLVRLIAERYGLKRGPEEVFEMSRFNGAGGYTEQEWLVFAYQDFGFAIHQSSSGRLGISKIFGIQLKRLRGYLKRYRVDTLPDLERPICDGTSYTFTHTTRNDIRSLYLNNPPGGASPHAASVEFVDPETPFSKGIVVYSRLVNLFEDLFTELQIDYTYGDGMKVLVPRERVETVSVWKQGADLRVLVRNDSAGKAWLSVDPASGKLLGPVKAPALESSGWVFDESSGKVIAAKDGSSVTLQKTSDGEGLWVANGVTYSGENPKTAILRIDPKRPTKQEVLALNGIDFDSEAMWVDEAEGMIYAATDGDLVRIPLKPSEKREPDSSTLGK